MGAPRRPITRRLRTTCLKQLSSQQVGLRKESQRQVHSLYSTSLSRTSRVAFRFMHNSPTGAIMHSPYTLTALLFLSRNFLQSRSGPSDMAVSSDTALTSIAQYKAQHSPKQGTALPSIAQRKAPFPRAPYWLSARNTSTAELISFWAGRGRAREVRACSPESK